MGNGRRHHIPLLQPVAYGFSIVRYPCHMGGGQNVCQLLAYGRLHVCPNHVYIEVMFFLFNGYDETRTCIHVEVKIGFIFRRPDEKQSFTLLFWPCCSELAYIVGSDDIRRNVNVALLLRSEEHTSELQSRGHLVCRLLLEKNKRRA